MWVMPLYIQVLLLITLVLHWEEYRAQSGFSLLSSEKVVTFTPNSYIYVTSSKISDNILTNAETIGQTIQSFISVITKQLGGVSKQATESGGSGSSALLKIIPVVLSTLTSAHGQLQTSLRDLLTTNILGGGGIASLLSATITLDNSQVENNIAGKNVSSVNSPFTTLGVECLTMMAELT